MSCSIAVVVPSYNRIEFLIESLNSIQQQTLKPYEVVVVDDCSSFTDVQFNGSISHLGSLDIRFIQKDKNTGACNSRNIGAKLSACDYVAFLDDDDVWEPDHLQLLLNAMQSNGAVLAYSGKKITNFSTGSYRNSLNVIPDDDQFTHLLRCNFPGSTSSVMVRRDAFLATGGFDESLPAIQDYDFYLRISKFGKIVSSKAYTLKYRDDTPVKITNQLNKARFAYYSILSKYEGFSRRALARTILMQNIKKALINFRFDYLMRFVFDYCRVMLGRGNINV